MEQFQWMKMNTVSGLSIVLYFVTMKILRWKVARMQCLEGRDHKEENRERSSFFSSFFLRILATSLFTSGES